MGKLLGGWRMGGEGHPRHGVLDLCNNYREKQITESQEFFFVLYS